MRRQPSQDRAHATIDAVLKAAETEIDQGGLDQLTTKRIAATAGLSVGAVYEYFPNKEAILAELVTRWLSRVYEVLDSVHPRHGGGLDIISYLVTQSERATRLYEDQPGLGALLDMLTAMPSLRGVSDSHDEKVLQSVTSALGHYAPRVDPAELRDTAQSILTISHPMVTAAIIYRVGDRERLLTHLRVCLIALGSRLLTLS